MLSVDWINWKQKKKRRKKKKKKKKGGKKMQPRQDVLQMERKQMERKQNFFYNI